MTDFGQGHHRDLLSYFGGDLEGDLGLQSWAGHYLDAARAAATSEDAPRPPDCAELPEGTAGWLPVHVLPVSQSATAFATADVEIHPGALRAARESRRIRAIVARLDATHARVLRAYYTTITAVAPPGFPHGLRELGDHRLVAAVLHGPEHVREIIAGTRSTNGTRAEAKRELKAVQRSSVRAVEHAQHAYAEAAEAHRADRRASRVLRSLEHGPALPEPTPWRAPPSVRHGGDA